MFVMFDIILVTLEPRLFIKTGPLLLDFTTDNLFTSIVGVTISANSC